MIDKISYKIINEFRYDGRLSNASLARRLGISMTTVAKKVNAMIEDGTVVIKAMPNPAKMGFHSQALIGLSVDPKKIAHVCKKLTDNIHVHMVTTCFGRYNILLIVLFQELEMLQGFIKTTLSQIQGIHRIEPYYLAKYRNSSDEILGDIASETGTPMIDELDKKIIRELILDGRPNYADLARKMGVSKPTISRRIAQLLKRDLMNIVAIPNPSKLGYTANAFVALNVEHPEIDNIISGLVSNLEVHLVLRLLNDFDILFGVYSTNIDTLYDLLNKKIGSISGIVNMESFICGNFFHFNPEAAFAFIGFGK